MKKSLAKFSTEELYEIAFLLYKNGKYDKAVNFFTLMTLLHPLERKFWMGLGACHEMLKGYDKAIECYGVAAVHDPEDPLVHWHAANCFFCKGDETKALGVLKTAIEVASKNQEHESLVPSLQNFEQLWSSRLGCNK
jgi:type III secretion system low calcium response chaperone LcrH/SycD